MRLPLIDSCGCSRRTILKGLAAGTALAAVGCINNGGGTENTPTAVFTMCGANACIDVNDSRNAVLGMPGGALLIKPSAGTIIVIRTGAASVAALSDVCTHAQCGVDYDASSTLLVCPCHGSEFQLSGSVAKGPARLPLKVYTASIDTATNTITVTL